MHPVISQTQVPGTAGVQGQGNRSHEPDPSVGRQQQRGVGNAPAPIPNVAAAQVLPSSVTYFVTGLIPAPHQQEYQVITMAEGPSPGPIQFFQKELQINKGSTNEFSQWSYNCARANGSCVHENPSKGEYIWAWEVKGSVFGSPLAVTTALYMRARYRNNRLSESNNETPMRREPRLSPSPVQPLPSQGSPQPPRRHDPIKLPLAPVRPDICVQIPPPTASRNSPPLSMQMPLQPPITTRPQRSQPALPTNSLPDRGSYHGKETSIYLGYHCPTCNCSL